MSPVLKISFGLFIIALPIIVASAMIVILALSSWAPAFTASVIMIGLAVISAVIAWVLNKPGLFR